MFARVPFCGVISKIYFEKFLSSKIAWAGLFLFGPMDCSEFDYLKATLLDKEIMPKQNAADLADNLI